MPSILNYLILMLYNLERKILNQILNYLFYSKIRHVTVKVVRRNFYIPEKSKRVSYKIIPPSINSNEENSKIYSEIESGINDNKQVILNINKKSIEPQDIIQTMD